MAHPARVEIDVFLNAGPASIRIENTLREDIDAAAVGDSEVCDEVTMMVYRRPSVQLAWEDAISIVEEENGGQEDGDDGCKLNTSPDLQKE